MLKRKYSIDKNKFSQIYKRCNFKSNNYFGIRYSPNHKNYSQFAIIVSKKIEKSAVKRNRIRRFLKCQISDNLEKIRPGFYYVIYLKENASEVKLKNELNKILFI
jgi:ribonuclease P protein component